jgi:hypothetical protein
MKFEWRSCQKNQFLRGPGQYRNRQIGGTGEADLHPYLKEAVLSEEVLNQPSSTA